MEFSRKILNNNPRKTKKNKKKGKTLFKKGNFFWIKTLSVFRHTKKRAKINWRAFHCGYEKLRRIKIKTFSAFIFP